MPLAFRKWLWRGLIIFALWFLFIRQTPLPRTWGNWEATGSTPVAASVAFMRRDGEGGETRSDYAIGPFAWVKIHRNFRGDDSVHSADYTVKLRRIEGTWRVRGATYSQNCLRSLWVLGRSCI